MADEIRYGGGRQCGKTCRAYQVSDSMICSPCALSWDMNDPSPPVCPKNGARIYPQCPSQAELNMRRALQTFAERNAEYGGNYRQMGAALLALFPPGGIPAIKTEADATRLNLMIDILGKLQRYAFAFHKGGHKDSAHDIMPYAAMLEEVTE